MINQHGGNNKRKIVKINSLTNEIIETYNSLQDAAIKNNIKKYTQVLAVASGKRKHVMGMVFKYIEEYNNIDNNVNIPLATTSVICKICNIQFDNARNLASHLQFGHEINSEEYTITHLHSGIRPSCFIAGCTIPVRYVSFEFKKYCKTHSHLAESEAGKIGQQVQHNKK